MLLQSIRKTLRSTCGMDAKPLETGRKNIRIKECKANFIQKSNRDRHIRNMHSDVEYAITAIDQEPCESTTINNNIF